jgi:Transposase DDE domain group 1
MQHNPYPVKADLYFEFFNRGVKAGTHLFDDGEQEHGVYNGHFEGTCYHPLSLFNGEGDCLAVKLRPCNVHSAEAWDEVLLPEMEHLI